MPGTLGYGPKGVGSRSEAITATVKMVDLQVRVTAPVAGDGAVLGFCLIHLPKSAGAIEISGVAVLPATFHSGLRSRPMSNGGTMPITSIPPRMKRE